MYEKKVIAILKKNVPKAKQNNISLDDELVNDLEINSMKLLAVITELERKTKFSIDRLPDDFDFMSIVSVRDVVMLVEEMSK